MMNTTTVENLSTYKTHCLFYYNKKNFHFKVGFKLFALILIKITVSL